MFREVRLLTYSLGLRAFNVQLKVWRFRVRSSFIAFAFADRGLWKRKKKQKEPARSLFLLVLVLAALLVLRALIMILILLVLLVLQVYCCCYSYYEHHYHHYDDHQHHHHHHHHRMAEEEFWPIESQVLFRRLGGMLRRGKNACGVCLNHYSNKCVKPV